MKINYKYIGSQVDAHWYDIGHRHAWMNCLIGWLFQHFLALRGFIKFCTSKGPPSLYNLAGKSTESSTKICKLKTTNYTISHQRNFLILLLNHARIFLANGVLRNRRHFLVLHASESEIKKIPWWQLFGCSIFWFIILTE